MENQDIRLRVRNYIVTSFLFGDASRLGDETSFLEGSILDSTGMLELINFIEQEFAIAIDPAELIPANLDSVERVAAFVEKKRAAGVLGSGA